MSNKTTTPNFIRIMKSTLAAAFGVQSNKNREEDFSNASIIPYIAAGIIFTIVFVFVLVGVVYLVINGLQKNE